MSERNPSLALVILVPALSCAAASTGSVDAETAYRDQQMACVDRFDTAELMEACREKVRQRWGTARKKDGGP